jgi:hypothetical protein
MVLKIKPDFKSKTLPDCEEILQITAREEVMIDQEARI